MPIIVQRIPTSKMIGRLWTLARGQAVCVVTLYVLVTVLVLGLALGGFYAAAKVQEDGSLIVAGVVALGSFLLAEELNRHGRPEVRTVLEAALDRAERINEANRQTGHPSAKP